ncbi:MAG TPA: EAL domain-containing protein [Novosphingobium sp.]|nr:EAL domain-containing protein [Novosphingobium sp.]
MAQFGKVGHELIRQTPMTLLALTRHPVEPHEEDWFARCRGDYLRSFPVSLLDLVRLAMLLSLVGPFTSLVFTLTASSGWAVVAAVQLSVRRNDTIADFDQRAALRYRGGSIRARAIWWCAMLAWGIVIAPHGHHEGLVALGAAMMAIDGIALLTLPYLALGVSLATGVALVAGLFMRDGMAAAPVAVVVLMLATFLHWSIYNLYYLFATRRIRTKRLAQSNETIRLLLNQYDDEGSDWLYEIDAAGHVANPSVRFCNACGLGADRLGGMSLAGLFHEGVHRQELQEKLDRGESFRNLVLPLTVNGEERWWSINGRPADRTRGKEGGWRGFIADITDAKKAEAKIAYMAHFDLLTGLPNRTLFNATLEWAMMRMSERRSVGLLFVDLDHFKEINDGHGHAAGDAVLAEVGRRLEQTIRPGDVVARLGGDEFVVLLPDLPSRDVCLEIAERLLDDIARPIEIDGQAMPVGASIGAAFAPENGETADELLRAADLAMYEAKLRGRNGVSAFRDVMREQMQERRDLAIGLRHAMARDELELHYQPLVDISTGETSGYEALVRWNHPQKGILGPDLFIPIAEETALIGELGAWVIRNALADAAQWPEHVTIAVNVSPAQMRDEGLLLLIANALAASGVAPHRLELEITENLFIHNSDEVLSVLHKLRSIGVRISLDDFGTGYSSLNYLRSFPFDKIKIDRSFVAGLADREDCQAIVQSVITLARDLQITTIAEGVENETQLDALRQQGCTQVQGFLFSPALPSQELPFDRTRTGMPAPDNLLSLPGRREEARDEDARPGNSKAAGALF